MSFWPIALAGKIESGRLIVNRPYLRSLLAGRPDCDVELLIDRHSATRSVAQNAYYWGAILGLIAESTGQPADDLHEFFKQRYNVKPIVLTDRAGVIVAEQQIGASTRTLSTVTFADYCEQIRAFAADRLDVRIPDPDPAWNYTRPASRPIDERLDV